MLISEEFDSYEDLKEFLLQDKKTLNWNDIKILNEYLQEKGVIKNEK